MCPDNFDDHDDSEEFGEADDSERRDESEHRNDRGEADAAEEREEADAAEEREENEREEADATEEREEIEDSDEEPDHEGDELESSGPGGRARSGDRDDPSRIRAGPRVGLREGFREFLELLRSLDEAEERRGAGHVRGGRSRIDYDVSIGTGFGIGDLRDRPERRRGRPRGDRPRGRSRRERRSEDTSGYHVTTREEEDEIVVIADLPGVGADELTAGFERHGETLVVAVEDVPVERVSLPWPAKAEWSSFNNGVLEVHLREEK